MPKSVKAALRGVLKTPHGPLKEKAKSSRKTKKTKPRPNNLWQWEF